MSGRGGFGLADLALGLGVVSALMAAVSLGWGALERSRLTQAQDNVARLRQAVRTWAELGQTSYAALSAEALAAARVLPTQELRGPWGERISLGRRPSGGYWIVLEGLPDSAVAALARAYEGQALEVVQGPGRLSLAFQ